MAICCTMKCNRLAWCCKKMGCPWMKFSSVVRLLTMFAALFSVIGSAFAFAMHVKRMSNIIDCGEPCSESAAPLVEASLGAFAIHAFIATLCILIFLTEFHLLCIAHWFGFLAFRFGRGMCLLVCGLVEISYSRASLAHLEAAGHAPVDSSILETTAGSVAAAIGLLNLVLALLPKCCKAYIPADELAVYFKGIKKAAKAAQVSKGVSEAVKAGKCVGDITMVDVEAGGNIGSAKKLSDKEMRLVAEQKRQAEKASYWAAKVRDPSAKIDPIAVAASVCPPTPSRGSTTPNPFFAGNAGASTTPYSRVSLSPSKRVSTGSRM